jgi:uncharacterized protein (DUF924 family)
MTSAQAVAGPDEVLTFWFGSDPNAVPDEVRERWFRKSDAFDGLCRERFLPTHEAAASGLLDHWRATPRGSLALVIVLDQLSRNMFRGTPRSFASDPAALAIAQDIVWRRWDSLLAPVERSFAYLPFEHSERLSMQRESVRLFARLVAYPETAGLLDWANRHCEIVARFGRFPHRNAILGRVTTAEEAAFLLTPGSAF